MKYKSPPGKPYPAKFANRQGITEQERNLQTGKERYGKDLYQEIPNDPTVDPRKTAIIPEFSDKKPKVTQFSMGLYDVKIKPERKEIVYTPRSPFKRRRVRFD